MISIGTVAAAADVVTDNINLADDNYNTSDNRNDEHILLLIQTFLNLITNTY